MKRRRVMPAGAGAAASLPTTRWKFSLPIAFCSGVISSAMKGTPQLCTQYRVLSTEYSVAFKLCAQYCVLGTVYSVLFTYLVLCTQYSGLVILPSFPNYSTFFRHARRPGGKIARA